MARLETRLDRLEKSAPPDVGTKRQTLFLCRKTRNADDNRPCRCKVCQAARKAEKRTGDNIMLIRPVTA